jgi:hypothetical protein
MSLSRITFVGLVSFSGTLMLRKTSAQLQSRTQYVLISLIQLDRFVPDFFTLF